MSKNINHIKTDITVRSRGRPQNMSDFRKHLKTPLGEKAYKCNQCDFASVQAGNLRAHLKTRSGEKVDKCNQCHFASVWADNLRRQLRKKTC